MLRSRFALPILLAGVGACAQGSALGTGAGAGGQGGMTAGTGGGVTTSSSAAASSSGAMVCIPGKQDPCACPGGAPGAQACNAAGTGYEPCMCPSSSSSSSGTTSTSASSSSSGTTSTSASSSSSGTTSSSASSSSSSTTSSSSSGGAGGCPGQPITLVGGMAMVHGDTSPYTNKWDGYCINAAPQESGGDVVYSVVAATSGTLKITVTPSGFSAVVSVTEGTCDGSVMRACAWGVNVGVTTMLTYSPVTAGTTYYVYVDGYSLSGPFDMTIMN